VKPCSQPHLPTLQLRRPHTTQTQPEAKPSTTKTKTHIWTHRGGRGRRGSRKYCNERNQQLHDSDGDDTRDTDAARRRAGGAAAADQMRGDSGKGTKLGAKRTAAAAAVELDEERVLESAARFSQAASELQLLGVWRAGKRRKVAAVQRVFAPMVVHGVLDGVGAALLEDDEDVE